MKRSRPSKECAPLIMRIVAHTAEQMGITGKWTAMFSDSRESPDVATARSLAMVVCLAAGVPVPTVCSTFKRSRPAVDAARQVQMTKTENDPFYRDRYIAILVRASDPHYPVPELPALPKVRRKGGSNA